MKKEYMLWVVPEKPQTGDEFGIRIIVKAPSKLEAIQKALAYVPGSITIG